MADLALNQLEVQTLEYDKPEVILQFRLQLFSTAFWLIFRAFLFYLCTIGLQIMLYADMVKSRQGTLNIDPAVAIMFFVWICFFIITYLNEATFILDQVSVILSKEDIMI